MENSALLAQNRYTVESGADETPITEENIIDVVIPDEIVENTQEMILNSDSLTFELGSADTNFLTIPVPRGTEISDITIENHYLIDEMRIIIAGVSDDFYVTNFISGNREKIISGSFETAFESATLKFVLDDIYEYRSILEDNNLYIEFIPPREMHSRIIVIDPAFGGSETGIVANDLAEKDVALNIAMKLKELLDQTDYMVYYTRTADNNLSEEKRVRIANNTRADMLIRIEADGNDNSLIHGTTTIYNSSFFIPHFGSPDLAYILETEVVLSILSNAIGLEEATFTDYVIANATVPAAAIRVGHLTNAQEATLLKRDDYLDKIALGIFNAILAICEEQN
ncbi:MAG: N-acetylmuramoyl-L-alanine amidase [Lachnospiraceae bacterium]|nr:N-acetylmuramoyl-L-alanine amidase [Lachnospiraceae bacterium]